MSPWDEFSGRDLAIEVALDAQGAACEIETLRRRARLLPDLCERLARAEALLAENAAAAQKAGDTDSAKRLGGKRQGVALALSYAEEMQR